MRANPIRFALLFTTLLPPATLAAQGVRIDIVPHAGLLRPTEALGPVTTINGPWYVHLEKAAASATFGATAGIDIPPSRLGGRITAMAVLPGDADARFLCRPDMACPAILLEASNVDVSQLSALGDLVFSIIPDGAVRTWVAAGAGFRRYDITWPAAAAFIQAGSHAETIPVVHTAIGVDIRLGGSAIRAEIGSLWSPEGDPILTPTASAAALRRTAQTDILFSLGWRLASF